MTAETQEPKAPPPPTVGRLHSLRGVRRELAKIYVDARQGALLPSSAAKLAYILTCLTKVLEVEILERRLDAIERHAGYRSDYAGRPRMVGHG